MPWQSRSAAVPDLFTADGHMEVKGVLPMLVLSVIAKTPAYGGEIREQLQNRGDIRVDDGTLYPLLRKFQRSGFVKIRKVANGPGRPVQRCTITDAGQQYLKDQLALWHAAEVKIKNVLGSLS